MCCLAIDEGGCDICVHSLHEKMLGTLLFELVGNSLDHLELASLAKWPLDMSDLATHALNLHEARNPSKMQASNTQHMPQDRSQQPVIQ